MFAEKVTDILSLIKYISELDFSEDTWTAALFLHFIMITS